MNIGLYFITSSDFGRTHEELAEAVLKAGVKFIQFREKETSVRKMFEVAKRIRKLTWEYSATFVVNDRVDLALAVEADGVHLGQDDFPYEVVREIFDGIVGVSTHSVDEAKKAEKYVDYISVGPIFRTVTKKDAKDPIGLEGLRIIVSSVKKPVVAIGGINKSNIEDVLKTGVKGVAVISAVANSQNPEKSAKELLEIVKKYLNE
ncbi:thiamine phosphate synthase [Archaeoglobus sp.]